MFWNYLKIAFRNHMKRKWNSLINVFGLAMATACCLLIFAYVSDELSYDGFHRNADNIYRIFYQGVTGEGEVRMSALLPHEMVKGLEDDYPAVKEASSFKTSRALFEHGDRRFFERLAMVDPSFLSMFSFPLLVGDPERALRNNNHILVTPKVAEKFFGDVKSDCSRAIGRHISGYGWRGRKEYLVVGILKPVPKTSSLQFDVLMLYEDNDVYGGSNNPFGKLSVYVQLNDGQRRRGFETSLSPLVGGQFGKTIDGLRKRGDLKDSDDCFQLKVQPLSAVYFDRDVRNAYESRSSIVHSYVLIGIGLLVLAIACINLITSSIGHSLSRATEIGIRKVLGATTRQMVAQNCTEKAVLVSISILLACVFAGLLLPTFNQLSRKEFTISVFGDPVMPLLLVSLFLVCSFFAAVIPSLILSRFTPAGVFRSMPRFGGKSRSSSLLVIAQFSLSVFLLTCTLVMSRQASFIDGKDLGYDEEDIVVVPVSFNQCRTYKANITKYPGIVSATGCDRDFSSGSSSKTFLDLNAKPIGTRIIRVDEDYVETLGLDIVDGRNFSEQFPSDRISSVIVNETLVREFGLEKPIGRTLLGDRLGDQQPTIIGVVGDYHIDPMHREVMPLILHMTNEITGPWAILVKIRSGSARKSVEILEDEWRELIPDRDFRYSFLVNDLAGFYEDDKRWQKIAGFSTLFSFTICSLGLLALSSMIVSSRSKEIAIRKVQGATVLSIIELLIADVTKWVIIANVIALPVSWYTMNRWLENYAYRIGVEWWTFLVAAGVSLLVALATVGYQTMIHAAAHPVGALKYE